MACNSCAKPFSLLRKEKGCPGCGFSFCSKCLNEKMFVAKLNKETKVCLKCKQADKNTMDIPIQPPDAFLKRLETNPPQPTTSKEVNSKLQQPDKAISNKNLEIEERLQKLKTKEGVIPQLLPTENEIEERLKKLRGPAATATDGQIQERLAILKGEQPNVGLKKAIPPVDQRSDQEKADDLIRQYLEETTIDESNREAFDSRISDIEVRLNSLKGNTGVPVPTNPNDENSPESEDDEEYAKKIIEKLKAEALLDTEQEFEETPTNKELPWCEICNEDAKMRCLGCRYLFCKTCFLEHKDDDDGCNKYEPYIGQAQVK